MTLPFGFDGAHGTNTRPAHVAPVFDWAKNESSPGANDGTRITAAWLNRIVAQFRHLAEAFDVSISADRDDDLANAITAAAVAGLASVIVDNLTTNDATKPLSAAQGKTLKDLIDGLGDVIVVADLTAAAALTGLDKGDLVHVVDNGSSKWVRYQVTAAGDGTWAGVTKIVYWTQDQAPSTHAHTVADLSNASANAKTFLQAADNAAMRAALLLGTAALLDHGTGNGNLVRLDPTTGKLPAVDGSLLTGLPGGFSGAYADLTGKPTLGTAAALNHGTGNGNLVRLDETTGKLPAVDGSLLTNLPSTGITLGTPVASTSGTAIDFTGIPSTAKAIRILFDGVSTNGTSNVIIQLGDSGGFETTGYAGTVLGEAATGFTAYSSGFMLINAKVAAQAYTGVLTLTLMDPSTNTWSGTSILARDDGANVFNGAGSKSLSGALTQLRITTAGGANTFDLGKINIQYS